jgi:hypothetical protein
VSKTYPLRQGGPGRPHTLYARPRITHRFCGVVALARSSDLGVSFVAVLEGGLPVEPCESSSCSRAPEVAALRPVGREPLEVRRAIPSLQARRLQFGLAHTHSIGRLRTSPLGEGRFRPSSRATRERRSFFGLRRPLSRAVGNQGVFRMS